MNVQSLEASLASETSDKVVKARRLENRRVQCYAVIAAFDTLALTVSFLFANGVYLGDLLAQHGTTMLVVVIPIYLWVAVLNDAYSGQVLRDFRLGAFKAVRALLFAGAAMLIIAYSFKVGEIFSRVIFWSGLVFSAVVIFSGRILLGRLLLKLLGGTPFSVVVIVDRAEWHEGLTDVIIDAQQIGFDPKTDNPMHFDKLATCVAHADRVLVACKDDYVVEWAHVLKCMGVDGEIVAPDVDRIGMVGVSHYRGRRTLVVSAGPLHLRDRTIKRMFDVVASSLAITLLSPVLVAVAVAIKVESPGPILFRQQRIGRDNKLFTMLKFRSMYHDRCDGTAALLTARGDDRVTRTGNFIRSNSIDELPQLFNVLRGDMSMVGPRPHALSAKAAQRLYWEIDERYRHRHAVKPGVTGLAQIRGFRGATVSADDLMNRLASDLEYLRDWSMSKDILILMRTVFVLRHKNAY